MKFPKTIKIGGTKYKIAMVGPEHQELQCDDGSYANAMTNWEKQSVFISEAFVKEAPDRARETFLHEMVHLMLHTSGNEKLTTDETLVSFLAHAIDSLLVDNSSILALYPKTTAK